MRIATLRTPDGTQAIRVESFEESSLSGTGTVIEGFADVGELLRCADWQERAAAPGASVRFKGTELAPVIPQPGKIICVGLNYARHIKEMGRELPEVPTLFIKFPDALCGPFDPVHIAHEASAQLDAEAELAVVVGTRVHRASREEAHEAIAGYAVMNDYTQRDWQRRTLQFHQGKSYYKSSGFGPWLDTEWTPGPRITARWDGELFQDSVTSDLIFDCETLISFVSQIYPLNPGDVIATGTPDGVGFASGRFIQHGETVRCEIEGLGFIENTTHIDR